MIRQVEDEADYAAYAQVHNAMYPHDPTTGAQIEYARRAHWSLLLVEVDGEVAATGIGGLSHLPDRCFLVPHVLPDHRGRGIGTMLVHALAAHGRTLGTQLGSCAVDGSDEKSLAFARKFGFNEILRELQQVRELSNERAPTIPAGVVFVSIAERPELLEAAHPLGSQGYVDMPTPERVAAPLENWLHDEATHPGGSFVAIAGDELVGYAGLVEHAHARTAEHGLTVVRKDWRRRGLASALKQAQAHWASANGFQTLVTWTQSGNEAMQSLNEALGYRRAATTVRMWGVLPSPERRDPHA